MEYTAPKLHIGVINRETAYSAYAGTSFSPDMRADSIITEFCNIMQSDWVKIEKYSEQDMSEFFNTHLTKCIEKYSLWLTAKSRCLSTMIAGPSNFPVRRAEKANNSERKRYDEFSDFRNKSLKYIRKSVQPYGDGSTIYSNDPDALKKLSDKLENLKKSHEIMKEANIAIRSKTDVHDKLKGLGLKEEQINTILNPDKCRRLGFEAYVLSGNNSEIKRIEARIRELELKLKASPCGPFTFDKGTIEIDNSTDRLRILFSGKPDVEMRQALKSKGFRWAPSVKAWQRQLTNNAIYATELILKVDLKPAYM